MLVLLALACTAAPDSGGDTASGASWPADNSSAGIAAFVASEAWRADPWVAETASPREELLAFSPHERVRVFLNEVLIASKQAGNGGYEGRAHLTGSMAIKRMHGADDALLGTAVMLKLEGDDQEWVYWCDGPEDLCGARFSSTPYHAVSYDAECAFCHGGNIYNTLGDGR
jgi:hypothetical protein